MNKFDGVGSDFYIDNRHAPSQHRQVQAQGQMFPDVSSLGAPKHSAGLMPAGHICGRSMAFRFPRDGVQPSGCPSQKTSRIMLQLVKHSRAQSVLSRPLREKEKYERYLEGGLGYRRNDAAAIFVYVDSLLLVFCFCFSSPSPFLYSQDAPESYCS